MIPSEKGESLHPNRLPVQPFRKLLVERYARDGDLNDIATQTGLAVRSISRIISGYNRFIEFPSADAIVTYLHGPMLWHEDEELAEIYSAVDIKALDWHSPTSEEVRAEQLEILKEAFDRLGSVLGAAREVGTRPDTAANILQNAGIDTTPKREYLCRNGHDVRVLGRYSDGSCKKCALERNRVWRESKNPDRKKRKLRSAIEEMA